MGLGGLVRGEQEHWDERLQRVRWCPRRNDSEYIPLLEIPTRGNPAWSGFARYPTSRPIACRVYLRRRSQSYPERETEVCPCPFHDS